MKNSYRIGCVGLLCDLPLYVAQARSYFADEGLAVELVTELGWSSIEAKLASGALQAANVPSLFPLAARLGLGRKPLPLIAPLVTSANGYGLYLSDKAALQIDEGSVTELRLGVESPFTLAPLFTRLWARQQPAEKIGKLSLLPLAVSQMRELLAEGFIHGFAASEPVPFLASLSVPGKLVARGAGILGPAPHSVLTCPESLVSERPDFVAGLRRALERASQYCAKSEHHGELAHLFLEQKSSAMSTLGSTLVGGLPPRLLAEAMQYNVSGHLNWNPLVAACQLLPNCPAVPVISRTLPSVFPESQCPRAA